MIPTPDDWRAPHSSDYYLDYYLHGSDRLTDDAPRAALDRSALVHALTHTGIGEPARVLTGTEASDVADLVFGPAGNREGSPFADCGDATCRHQEARLPAESYREQEK